MALTLGVEAAGGVFLLLLLFVVVFALVARRLDTPYPIVLVVAGLALSLIPGTPSVDLDPDVVFYVVLPPLLYAAAWTTSWREFSPALPRPSACPGRTWSRTCVEKPPAPPWPDVGGACATGS